MTFQAGLESAPRKSEYLSGLSKNKKTSINQQIEAFVVQFLNDNGLQIKGGSGGEEMVTKNALNLVVPQNTYVTWRRGLQLTRLTHRLWNMRRR